MDFSKTKIYQRTRSGYEKLYKDYSQKKSNGKRSNVGVIGVGSVSESDGGENSKDKSCKKSSEVLQESDESRCRVRNEVNPVARRTRQACRERTKVEAVLMKGKNAREVYLIEDSDDDVTNCVKSGVEEASRSENIEGTSRKNASKITKSVVDELDGDGVELSKRHGKNRSKKGYKSLRTKDLEKSGVGDDDDDALSYPGDSCKLSKSVGRNVGKSENELETGVEKDTSLSSRGFSLSPGFKFGESDDDEEGIMYLGDDAACLDDCDPSHSSRVESNEVKVSPVEMDSVEADADVDADADDKVQGRKSSEEEDDDLQKVVSLEEDGSDCRGVGLFESNAAARDEEVISLSSSSDCEVVEKDGDATDDGLDEKFWAELLKHSSVEGHEENDDCVPRVINPKPVCEHKKKTERVNVVERVVSKKRSGSSNEMWQAVEGSKKSRIDADSSHCFANKGVDDTYWQVVDEKPPQIVETCTIKKYDQFGNKINVIQVLTDAIRDEGDGDNVLKRYVDIPPEDILFEETQVDEVLSYKFKFEDDEDIKPDNLESEMEVDGLFDEMNMCLQLSEIGSSDTRGVRCVDSGFLLNGANQSTRCRRGQHELSINDQFGIVCRYCSYVEMEIRDILPPLSKNGRGGHGRHDPDKTDNGKFSDLKLTDCNQERHHDSKVGEYEKGTVWDLVPGVKESMYPHQRDGFEFIWTKIAGGTYIDKLEKRLPTGGSGCIISHAPGTGKSRLTIVFLQAFLKMYPTSRPLIIAPRSMLLTWEEEFKKWKVDFPFFNLNNIECSGKEHKAAVTLLKNTGGIKSSRGVRLLKVLSWKKTPSVLGITYRLFESLAGEEGKKKRDANNVVDEQMKTFLLKVPTLLVLDEGHTPRNDQSQMWKTLLNVRTKRSIILSGTPFQNNFDELYNTLCLVNPLLFFGISSLNSVDPGKKSVWKHTTAKGQWDSITSNVKKSQHKLQELKAMIDPFVHVHKGTILQERLPGLRDALVVLRPTKTQQTLLNKMSGSKLTLRNDCLMSLVSVHPSLLPKSYDNVAGFHKMLKVFENDPSAGVKTAFLMELIQLSMAHNEKVLVFSQYLRPLEFIMQLLNNYFSWIEGRECLYMDGKQEEKHRQNSINTLNDPKSEVKVLLASLRACSEGINLVGASRVVLLDVHWNPSVERQAISRAYRLGQKKLVHVYHLVTGSMEGEKYIRQVEKSHLSELVFSSKNKDSSNPTISSTVSKDKILEEMVQHEKLRNMFEKVIYQPKEADLIDTFG